MISRIERLSSLNPIAISVTWGAGGSTKDRSLELAGLTQEEYKFDTILHLTCTNMVKGMVDDVLRVCPFQFSTQCSLNVPLVGCQRAGY